MFETVVVIWVIVLVLVVMTLFAGVKTVPQGQIWTVERFGAYTRMLEPGLQFVLPYIDRIGSISGVLSYAGGAAYAASKAAVAMFTKTLALEAGPDGIRVNCICPGTIRHRPPQGNEDKPAHIPLGRAGTSADVAHLVSFLASDAAGYMTGAVITLDGGATAGRARVSKRRAP